ncbi:MAG: hypothetical protein IJA48_07420, partial [Oscillospiraceae bacterium]|nr:hypothetical protein [Oscillospiraceae bacterium]
MQTLSFFTEISSKGIVIISYVIFPINTRVIFPPGSKKQGFALLFAQLVKELPIHPRIWYNKRDGGVIMEQWRKDARSEIIIVDLEALVPQDH